MQMYLLFFALLISLVSLPASLHVGAPGPHVQQNWSVSVAVTVHASAQSLLL